MPKKETYLNHIILVIAAAVALLIGSVTAVYAVDETDPSDVDAGTYYGVPWRITADYELLIGEKGQEYSFAGIGRISSSVNFPWKEYCSEINTVTVLGDVHVSEDEYGNSLNGMFYNFVRCTSMDLRGLDTSGACYMNDMFHRCSSLTSLDVSGFNTCGVSEMDSMFAGCSSLTSLDLTGFDTSRVERMSDMFSGCSSLSSLDVTSFDTRKVEVMNRMFRNCSSLTSLDISSFTIYSCCRVGYMFGGCSALETITLPQRPGIVGVAGRQIYKGCENLKTVDISDLNSWCNGWCLDDWYDELCDPLNASPNAVLLLNGGTGSKVTLDEGCKVIPDRSFNGWGYLKEITLPESLKKIGASAFEGTTSLRTVNVNNLNHWLNLEFATENSSPLASGKAELRVRSGSEYDALSEVVIDKTVGSIPAYAFSGCRSLRSVVIPDSVTAIGTGAFASCETLSQIVIPDSVSVLQERVFADCKDLKKILIPESVTSIDRTAFQGCAKGLVLYGTPGSTAEAFASQQGIRFQDYSEYDAIEAGSVNNDIRWILTGGNQLTIEGTGDDVALENAAFEKIANKVTGVKIKGISRIGTGAFSSLPNLERVTVDINTPVESIDPAAFAGTGVEICCYPNSYSTVTRDLPGFTVKKLSGSRSGNVTWTYNENTGTLMLSSGSEEFGADFEPVFKDLDVRRVEFSDSFACRALPAGVFSGCTSLTEVRLAAQTTEIGTEAFKDCTNLRRVTWHDGVTKIGEGAFENCANLQQILLADSVLVNEYDQEMEDITVEIPVGVNVIPQRAFRSCRAIRKVDWYADAETEQTSGSIGAAAFENCSSLSEIGIPEHVESIGSSAFRSCEALCALDGELLFGENLNTLGAQAFSDCPKILTMSFGEDLSSIGSEALGTNTELTVEAPESAANLKGYCQNAGMTFISLEGMGDAQIRQDAYAKLKHPSITVKAGKSKKVAISTNGKVTGVKASNTKGKVSVSKSGHKVNFKGKSAVSGLRVKVSFNIKNSKSDTDSISVTVKKASSGLGGWTGDKQTLRADKQQVIFSSDAAAAQKVRITRSEGAEGALISTVSKNGIIKYTMKADGTLQISPVKAGQTTLSVYAEADDVFEASEPVRITVTVKARPARVTAKVKKLSKTKARVSWKKVNDVKSYQIQVSKSKTFKQKKTYSAKSTALKKTVKITKGKTNYIRVRYKLANGKAGKWSKTLVVKK